MQAETTQEFTLNLNRQDSPKPFEEDRSLDRVPRSAYGMFVDFVGKYYDHHPDCVSGRRIC